MRCTCEGFDRAFAKGEDYRCEHLLAVELALDPPAEEVEPVRKEDPTPTRIRVAV
jgi:hypothetical protein